MAAQAPSGSTRADSAEEVVVRVLGPGEQVQMFVECLRRQHFQLFEKAVLALTNKRMLIVTPSFPWGHELHAAFTRETAWVVNGKERVDGSRLLVLRHDEGTLCLYFSRTHRDDAEALLTAVGLAPKEGPPPPQAQDPFAAANAAQAAATPTVVDVDPVEMAQEFSGLLGGLEDEADDSY